MKEKRSDSNRTFMELKYPFFLQSFHLFELLQSHLYGIEIREPVLHRLLPSHSNRTFMELKYSKTSKISKINNYSNRTFMELKLFYLIFNLI